MSAPTVSLVRKNLLTVPGYTPYCGGQCSSMPRTCFDGEQFQCGDCGWSSSFEAEFIAAYREAAAPSLPCPTLPRARDLAAEWARGRGWLNRPDPHPELLAWVSAFMLERWSGEAIGSALTTGIEMAWAMGAALGILGDVRPVGSGGVLPLCEAAGWPKNPKPGESPLSPIR